MALPLGFDAEDFVRRTLAEDLGSGGDVTSSATIAADARFTAEMSCRQAMVGKHLTRWAPPTHWGQACAGRCISCLANAPAPSMSTNLSP